MGQGGPPTALTSISIGSGACTGGKQACDTIGSGPELLTRISIRSNSCQGQAACNGLVSGPVLALTSFSLGSNSCIGQDSCSTIGQGNVLTSFSIGSNVCIGQNTCQTIAQGAQALTSFSIGSNACHGNNECQSVAAGNQVTETFTIPSGGCTDANDSIAEPCDTCIAGLSGSGTITDLYLTQECCNSGDFSEATSTCVAPLAPKDPCSGNNCDRHGKCVANGYYDSKCVCENTFEEIVKSNGLPSCACPSGTLLQANVNCCVPIETSAPTGAPTDAPTSSVSLYLVLVL